MWLRTIQSSDRRPNLWVLQSVRRLFSVARNAAVNMASKEGELRVLVVAGEVSGDTIGSRLMSSLKKLSNSVCWCWWLKSATEEKTDTDKNMLTMFEILRQKKTVKLENLLLNRKSFACLS